jgi:heme/copper-type cytochrome/quinol oxidase subunit 2
VAPFIAGGSGDGSGRRRWADRIVGILVGVVLGLGVLVYFVFVHSEGTIDAPKVNEGKAGTTAGDEGGAGAELPAHPGSPDEPAEARAGAKQGGAGKPSGGRQGTTERTEAIPVVKVIGGAPPTGSGPKQLHFTKGEKVRFEIDTSEPFSFEIKGLGITQSIESTSTISFKATKTGQFPVIASTTLIGVADLLIKPGR